MSDASIPKLIHQIWKTTDLPAHASDSWRRLNQLWHWRIWTDEDLLRLVRDHYPDLEALYLSYPTGVQRADLGRYLILHHCGGVYADLDTECLQPLDVLASETRIVLCEEPVEHQFHAHRLWMERLYFNGIMAGPARHPFWQHLIALVVHCAAARARVLESTGPFVLTGAVLQYAPRAELALHSSHLFTPQTSFGKMTAGPEYGPLAPLRLANHFWRGSWLLQGRNRPLDGLKLALRKMRYQVTRGTHLARAQMAKQIDTTILEAPVSDGRNVAVLIPIRDGEPWLSRCMDLLSSLDYPAEHLSLTFCEGDSKDGTVKALDAICSTHVSRFRSIRLLTCNGGPHLERRLRWHPSTQKARRAHLAKVRNHLIDHGLSADDDWALWLDADVCDYPSDILRRLLAERVKVVTPDCRLETNGPSFDLNAFEDAEERRDGRYYKNVHRGLYQPPANHPHRRHLHDLRFLQRVPLSSVGGTMLLVDAAVHRAGLRFPEVPYDDLLETEGFGRMCKHFGVVPLGLPNVSILHVRT